MSKSILLIDDEESFKEAFKIISQKNGYRLAWGRSFEDLEDLLPRLVSKITAVVLDVKCLIKNNQEIEKPDFLGVAINHLNKYYSELPRIILTGDEKALDAFKILFNPETEDIFTKSPGEIEKLFEKVNEHHESFETRFLKTEEKIIGELLNSTEDKKLEFKSSLRYCLKEKIVKKELEFSCFKNIAAFLNGEGGTLLIGIDDERNVIGLDNSDFTTFKKENKIDEFKLHFDNLTENYFGNAVQRVIDVSLISFEGKTICKLSVHQKYQSPIFIKKKTPNQKAYDAFYIRRQASAKELKGKELDEYINGHWS
ncbi:RNA-binding domain-containing protein [Flagellimonas flava]|uniref:AlbA family DNA-binding domain-containing protein n=1 Tax=Flagellimonas flava TaxID=570519 RepID=UPI003D645EA4